jgi:two-component system chemotaxis response regulator CheY
MKNTQILVVDDSSCFRLIAGEMLKEMGFSNITQACDGVQAWQLLQNNFYDLVLSDYMMAEISGIDLLKKMKQDSRLAEVPFVLVSAVSDTQVMQQALDLGAASCILRPLAYNLFRKEVAAIVSI